MRTRSRACAAPVVALLAFTCATLIAFPQRPPATGGGIWFTDVTNKSGLNFQQSYGDRHLDNIVEGTGTGVCVFDYNNDGYLDVYFPNGNCPAGQSGFSRQITLQVVDQNGNPSPIQNFTMSDVITVGSPNGLGITGTQTGSLANVSGPFLDSLYVCSAACPASNSSTTGLQTWTGSGSLGDWVQTLTPSGAYSGRTVTESNTGPATDGCWFSGSRIAKVTGISGGSWTVGTSSQWGPDSIGWLPGSVEVYQNQRPLLGLPLPCQYTVFQTLTITCPNCPSQVYRINVVLIGIISATVSPAEETVSYKARHTKSNDRID